MPLTLKYVGVTSVPVEVEGLTPDRVAAMSLAEVERVEIFHGNVRVPLAEFFRAEGSPADGELRLQGDLSGVHWIGAKMASGCIRVEGPAGRHLGSEMRGGEIHVHGNAGDWVGGEMKKGLIHVRGNAGHLVGAAYRGGRRGMTGGTILVAGNAGNEVGHTMRRGLIAVGGSLADLVGFSMLAGTVLACGDCGIRPGAGMKRGTIALLGAAPPMLPTFRRACRYEPLAMRLLITQLKRLNFHSPQLAAALGPVELFNGDLLTGGRGEILLRAA